MESQTHRNEIQAGADGMRTARHLSIAIALGLGLALAIAVFGKPLSGAGGASATGSAQPDAQAPAGKAVSNSEEVPSAPSTAPRAEAQSEPVEKSQRRHPVIRDAARKQASGPASAQLDYQRLSFLQ
ncbi:hypothetical protein GR183_00690 [Stappia sp. GBMRC 2046]|uniref:Uncharacterized protein n=1 Tax=Stappia sediminis TaxID=2692190 RepID=A0A7X3S5Q9_9HYPH|nr:hypothetical protein [Stappia sediminis]MXN63407.1 hypothetical protein [Stappia sediminis]